MYVYVIRQKVYCDIDEGNYTKPRNILSFIVSLLFSCALADAFFCITNDDLEAGGRIMPNCLADKTNHSVETLSLNRSQCGSCSTKYDTSAST